GACTASSLTAVILGGHGRRFWSAQLGVRTRLLNVHAPAPASSAVEDYLKAVYALETRLEGPVPTNALAERLRGTARGGSGSRPARSRACCAGSTSSGCWSTSATAACGSPPRVAGSRCARCATTDC